MQVTGTSDAPGLWDDISELRVHTSLPATLKPALLSGNEFQLTIQGPSTRRYSVETSTNLMLWNRLMFVYPPKTLVETNAAILPQRFYRAILDPQW